MKKPLNYRLQMYRALVEKMCTNCWFWCIFCGFTLSLCAFGVFALSLQLKTCKKGMSYNLLKEKEALFSVL